LEVRNSIWELILGIKVGLLIPRKNYKGNFMGKATKRLIFKKLIDDISSIDGYREL